MKEQIEQLIEDYKSKADVLDKRIVENNSSEGYNGITARRLMAKLHVYKRVINDLHCILGAENKYHEQRSST